MDMPTSVVMDVSKIKPYENNPRRIPKSAVAAVKKSIEEYGYHQPIVVDRDNVIVVGHTRFLAMQELGIKKVEVYVTDLPEEKAREYRLVDNRTSEMGQWDHAALVIELREFEEELLDMYFPDVDLEVQIIEDELISREDVDDATKKILTVKEAPHIQTTSVVCPNCYHSFEVRTDSLPGLSRTDLADLTVDDGRAE